MQKIGVIIKIADDNETPEQQKRRQAQFFATLYQWKRAELNKERG